MNVGGVYVSSLSSLEQSKLKTRFAHLDMLKVGFLLWPLKGNVVHSGNLT